MNSWFLILLVVTTSGCNGIVGTLAWRSWEDGGVKVTEVRSAGIELRNLSGYRGSALGWRQTIYASRIEEERRSSSMDSRWRYVWLPDEGREPVHLSQITYGLEGGWERSFKGVSLGIASRGVSALPVEGDEVLEISLDTRSPGQSRFSLKKVP